MGSDFSIEVTTPVVPGGYLVQLRGVLNDQAELAKRLRALRGVVVFDLDGVTRVTSSGVREWVNAFSQLSAEYYAYVRCQPPFVRQFSMIAGLAGDGELISFYIPYACDNCDEYFDHLVDLRHEPITMSRPPELLCPSCGTPAMFDELDDYLAFASSQPRPTPPPLAEEMINSPEGAAARDWIRVSKRLLGDETVLRIVGNVHGSGDSSFRLRRWTDGLEGRVRADVSSVRFATREGFQRLVDAVPSPPVGRSVFEGARIELCPALVEAGHDIASVIIEGRCRFCGARVYATIGGPSGSEVSRCAQCGSLETIELPAADLAAARQFLSAKSLPERSEQSPRRARSTTPVSESKQPVVASAAFRRVVELAEQIASTESTVLLRGETGTGKELLARYIHSRSLRKDRPFVAVNCAAFPAGLIESELFGHEAGAFTGAKGRRQGRFERADTGTLFVDEIGDLPMEVQVKLLRALQERTIERLGGKTPIPVDIRLIAATHQDLEQMLQDGTFREDLYYRINVVPVVIPPLRERRDDILPLAETYLEIFQKRAKKKGLRLSETARRLLLEHSWPGNVRELTNIIERAVAVAPDGSDVTLEKLVIRRAEPAHSAPPAGSDKGLRFALEEFERNLIQNALARCDRNQAAAARLLKISRQTLRHKIVKYGLD